MGLQLSTSFSELGFSSSSAYYRVADVMVLDSPSGWGLKFEVRTYFSQTARNNGAAPIKKEWYTTTYDTTSSSQNQYNVVQECYEYLKTLTTFSGATDC